MITSEQQSILKSSYSWIHVLPYPLFILYFVLTCFLVGVVAVVNLYVNPFICSSIICLDHAGWTPTTPSSNYKHELMRDAGSGKGVITKVCVTPQSSSGPACPVLHVQIPDELERLNDEWFTGGIVFDQGMLLLKGETNTANVKT